MQEFKSIGGMRPLLRARRSLDADTEAEMNSILAAIRRRSPIASLLENLGLVVPVEAHVIRRAAKLTYCVVTSYMDCRQ